MSSPRIVAYPSVASSLHDLQFATSMDKVPLHGHDPRSKEMLEKGLSQNHGQKPLSALAGIPPHGSSRSSNPDMLTMRSQRK